MIPNKFLETGDIVFVLENIDFGDKLIRFFTGGSETHVYLVYNSDLLYETDTETKRTHVTYLDEYLNIPSRIFRISGLSDEEKESIISK